MGDFEKIYQEHGKTVYTFLLSLSHDEHLSEELTQEGYILSMAKTNSLLYQMVLSFWMIPRRFLAVEI